MSNLENEDANSYDNQPERYEEELAEQKVAYLFTHLEELLLFRTVRLNLWHVRNAD